MAEDTNLTVDIDETGLHGSGEYIARIAVSCAKGFTRDGAAPTITDDCRTLHSLETEVERLKAELDEALSQAAVHFRETEVARAQLREQVRESDSSNEDKPRLSANLTVAQVMTRNVRTLNENDKVALADELMQAGKFRHVVVLNDEGSVTGLVSHRDVFYSTIAWSTGLGKHAHQSALDNFPVKEVMTNDPAVIGPDMDLADAAAMMVDRKIGCLPVMDGNDLVGILTEGDFLALII